MACPFEILYALLFEEEVFEYSNIVGFGAKRSLSTLRMDSSSYHWERSVQVEAQQVLYVPKKHFGVFTAFLESYRVLTAKWLKRLTASWCVHGSL